jgi:hypothetical protein
VVDSISGAGCWTVGLLKILLAGSKDDIQIRVISTDYREHAAEIAKQRALQSVTEAILSNKLSISGFTPRPESVPWSGGEVKLDLALKKLEMSLLTCSSAGVLQVPTLETMAERLKVGVQQLGGSPLVATLEKVRHQSSEAGPIIEDGSRVIEPVLSQAISEDEVRAKASAEVVDDSLRLRYFIMRSKSEGGGGSGEDSVYMQNMAADRVIKAGVRLFSAGDMKLITRDPEDGGDLHGYWWSFSCKKPDERSAISIDNAIVVHNYSLKNIRSLLIERKIDVEATPELTLYGFKALKTGGGGASGKIFLKAASTTLAAVPVAPNDDPTPSLHNVGYFMRHKIGVAITGPVQPYMVVHFSQPSSSSSAPSYHLRPQNNSAMIDFWTSVPVTLKANQIIKL